MIGALSLLQHKPEHTLEQFRHHWLNVHGPLAAELHGVRRYVQSHFEPDDALTNTFARGLDIDGLAAISFDNEEDRTICYASRQEEICDVDSLLFIGATARYVTDVETFSTPDLSGGHKAVVLANGAVPDMRMRIDRAMRSGGISELIRHDVTAPGATPTQARRQITLPLQMIVEITTPDRTALKTSLATLCEDLAESDVAIFAATAHRIV